MIGKHYGAIVRTTGWWRWAFVLTTQRFPVAAAPLALVFAGRAAGSFAFGGVLVGVHALAETVAAAVLGRRLDRRSPRRELQAVFLVEALAFAACGAGLTRLPAYAALGLVALGGGIAAGAPGGLRAIQLTLVAGDQRTAALSLESLLNQLVWAAAPVLVSVLAVWSAGAALFAMALAAAGAAVGARRLPETLGGDKDVPGQSHRDVLRIGWPSYLQSAAIMFVVASSDVTLAPRLASIGAPSGLAGPLLAAFVLANLVGGLLYGARRWPGGSTRQSTVAYLAMCTALTGVALAPHPWAVGMALMVAGAAEGPALISRSMALQELLPRHLLAAGFSVGYAAAGLGYGAAGLLAGLLQPAIGPAWTLGVALAVGLVLASVRLWGDARPAGTNSELPERKRLWNRSK